MPPKKDSVVNEGITGFDLKETRLLAAAFIASVGPGKFDYDLMATLTGNTAGTLKKMIPVVKQKAIEAHPSFGTFVNGGAADTKAAAPKAAAPKANGAKKRKVAEADSENNEADVDTVMSDIKEKPKAKPVTRGVKKAKKVVKEEKESSVEAEEANGEANNEAVDDV